MARVTVCSDFGAQENQDCHCFHCFPNFCHEVMGPDAMIFVFRMLSFKPALSLFSFTFIKRLFNSTACMRILIYLENYQANQIVVHLIALRMNTVPIYFIYSIFWASLVAQ